MTNKQAAEAIRKAYEEGFEDGMQMYRSDFDQSWEDSQAKIVHDALREELERTK